jgi:hypothetical protein
VKTHENVSKSNLHVSLRQKYNLARRNTEKIPELARSRARRRARARAPSDTNQKSKNFRNSPSTDTASREILQNSRLARARITRTTLHTPFLAPETRHER